jgi:carboxymethylenebutenolidase
MTSLQRHTEQVPTDDGDRFDAELFLPDAGRGPGILLLQEIFGVGEFLVHKAEALAGAGYVVLCPDVFWRVERNVALPHDEESLGVAFGLVERYAALDPELNAADLRAALAHLRGLPEVEGPVAAMGYCLGGRLAYELAVAADPDVLVSYYGSGVADRLDVAGEVRCPALFHFGGQDPYIPMEQVEAIRAAFADRADVELVVEAAAGHAFENLFAPSFADPEAAARSWATTLDFLSRRLGRR